MKLSCPRQNGLTVSVHDAHVAPSGRRKIAGPIHQDAVKMDTIMGVECTRNKVLLDELHKFGISKDLARILTTLSAFPLNKIGEDGLVGFPRFREGKLHISTTAVFRKVDVPDITKFHRLPLA